MALTKIPEHNILAKLTYQMPAKTSTCFELCYNLLALSTLLILSQPLPCSILYVFTYILLCILNHMPCPTDLLMYYLVCSCCVGLCPLLASVVYWIAYPTSIVVYCLVLSGLLFVLEAFLEST